MLNGGYYELYYTSKQYGFWTPADIMGLQKVVMLKSSSLQRTKHMQIKMHWYPTNRKCNLQTIYNHFLCKVRQFKHKQVLNKNSGSDVLRITRLYLWSGENFSPQNSHRSNVQAKIPPSPPPVPVWNVCCSFCRLLESMQQHPVKQLLFSS